MPEHAGTDTDIAHAGQVVQRHAAETTADALEHVFDVDLFARERRGPGIRRSRRSSGC
jgi:hypothetical protein